LSVILVGHQKLSCSDMMHRDRREFGICEHFHYLPGAHSSLSEY